MGHLVAKQPNDLFSPINNSHPKVENHSEDTQVEGNWKALQKFFLKVLQQRFSAKFKHFLIMFLAFFVNIEKYSNDSRIYQLSSKSVRPFSRFSDLRFLLHILLKAISKH